MTLGARERERERERIGCAFFILNYNLQTTANSHALFLPNIHEFHVLVTRALIQGNLPYFERTFLTLVYIDITKHIYIRNRMVKVIMTRRKCGLWRYLFNMMCNPCTAHAHLSAGSQVKPYTGQFKLCKILGNLMKISGN